MDCTAHGVAKSQTQLSNFHFTRETKGARGCGNFLKYSSTYTVVSQYT